MADKKLLKTALIISVALLLLMIAACAGATYAWFTDQVDSQRNIIQVGSLDVELEFSHDGQEWHDLLARSNTFKDNQSWAPGTTQHVYLRISNHGSLALKYRFSLNILEETGTINMLGQNYELSEYLKVGYAEGVEAPGNVRAAEDFLDHVNKITATNPDAEVAIVEGSLSPEGMGNDSQIMTLIIRMPAELDQEVNYPINVNAPLLTFGLDVVATQAVAENDSFGDDYDINAEYPGITSPDLLNQIRQ